MFFFYKNTMFMVLYSINNYPYLCAATLHECIERYYIRDKIITIF
jgi:hypothetical protein